MGRVYEIMVLGIDVDNFSEEYIVDALTRI
jgi:hypothetical protein